MWITGSKYCIKCMSQKRTFIFHWLVGNRFIINDNMQRITNLSTNHISSLFTIYLFWSILDWVCWLSIISYLLHRYNSFLLFFDKYKLTFPSLPKIIVLYVIEYPRYTEISNRQKLIYWSSFLNKSLNYLCLNVVYFYFEHSA